MNHDALKRVVGFAVAAACEHVEFGGEDEEFGMGLWQTFRYEIPKALFENDDDYDVALTVLGVTYGETVRALVAKTATAKVA